MATRALQGEVIEIEKSDLAIQNDEYLLQFEYKSEKESNKKKYKLKPGIFNLESTQLGIVTTTLEMKPLRLLETNKSSTEILNEFNFFFERLNIYKELEIPPKRGVLLYGPPGTGKTANISKAINELGKNNDATVITWNASALRSSDVLDFFTTGVDYDKSVKKLIIIIEDIGMGVDGYGGPKEIDRSLLNLLDGSGTMVKVPTFFVATTNYAHNLPEPLIRPGRFDQWIEVLPPSADDRVSLFKFISKTDELDGADEITLRSDNLKDYSVAHLKELVIRCKRDGLSITDAVSQINALKKKFSKGFENNKSAGFFNQ